MEPCVQLELCWPSKWKVDDSSLAQMLALDCNATFFAIDLRLKC